SAFLTLSKHILRRAVGEIVTVLHRDDRRDALRPAQLIDADVGEADVPDLALALQFAERAHRLVKRHLRIGRMKLIDIDIGRASLARRVELFGANARRATDCTRWPF